MGLLEAKKQRRDAFKILKEFQQNKLSFKCEGAIMTFSDMQGLVNFTFKEFPS